MPSAHLHGMPRPITVVVTDRKRALFAPRRSPSGNDGGNVDAVATDRGPLHVGKVRLLPPALFESLRQAAGPLATNEGSAIRFSDQVFRQDKAVGTRWEMNSSDEKAGYVPQRVDELSSRRQCLPARCAIEKVLFSIASASCAVTWRRTYCSKASSLMCLMLNLTDRTICQGVHAPDPPRMTRSWLRHFATNSEGSECTAERFGDREINEPAKRTRRSPWGGRGALFRRFQPGRRALRRC
jgi:hypothetical protein